MYGASPSSNGLVLPVSSAGPGGNPSLTLFCSNSEEGRGRLLTSSAGRVPSLLIQAGGLSASNAWTRLCSHRSPMRTRSAGKIT